MSDAHSRALAIIEGQLLEGPRGFSDTDDDTWHCSACQRDFKIIDHFDDDGDLDWQENLPERTDGHGQALCQECTQAFTYEELVEPR